MGINFGGGDGERPDSGGSTRMLALASSGNAWRGLLGLSMDFFILFFIFIYRGGYLNRLGKY